MRLPIPYVFNGRRIVGYKIQAPKTRVLGDAREKAQKGDAYGSMAEIVKGSLASLQTEDDRDISVSDEIEKAVKPMPYKNIDHIVMDAIIASGVEDGIEGVYTCPLCGHKIIMEFDPEDESCDRISTLKVNYSESGAPFTIVLTEPIEIQDADTDEVLQRIESLTMRYPTLDDVQRAYRSVGSVNSVSLQLQTYANATIAVGGAEVDQKWRAEWGMFVFERIRMPDMRAIGKEIEKYGRSTTVDRHCPSCGKRWKAEVNTAGFFASGLQG